MISRFVAGALVAGLLAGCSQAAPAPDAPTSPSAGFAPTAQDTDYLAEVDKLVAGFAPQGRTELGYDDELTVALGRSYCATVAANGGSGGAQATELARMQAGMDQARTKVLGLMVNAAETVYCPEYK